METSDESLAQNLIDLVSPDEPTRNAVCQRFSFPSEELKAEIRATIASPPFPFHQWYARLTTIGERIRTDSMGMWQRERERRDRIEAHIRARYEKAVAIEREPNRALINAEEWYEQGPVESTMYARLRKVMSRETKEGVGQSRLQNQYLAIGSVFRVLREEILSEPERLREMLHFPSGRHAAEERLIALGTEAAPFFADELVEMFLVEGFCSTSTRKAIQAMLKDDAARIRRVAEELDSPVPNRRQRAAQILSWFGTDPARFVPDLVPKMLALLNDDESGVRLSVIYALGPLTHGTDVAVDTLLELSESEEVWTKRAALASLGKITRQPEKVVPRLIRAFDDFKDPDPDSYDDGSHEVVTNGLAAFGEAAAAALPVLVARIACGMVGAYDDEGNPTELPDWDKGVFRAIRKTGRAALAVLPELESHWRGNDEKLVTNDWDALAVTIVYLRKSRDATGAEP